MPWLRDMPLTRTKRTILDLGLDGAIEEADQVGVGQPHLASPFVRQGLGLIRPFLNVAQAEGDESHVESAGQASAHSLADQLGDGVWPVGHRFGVDCDRLEVALPSLAHDVVRAREDEPFDSGQGRGVKDVGQGIEVGADQIVPEGVLVGIGRQMNDRVDSMEVRDPIIVQDLEIGR